MIDTIKYIEKIALIIIIFATVIAIGYEIYAMYEKNLVELADLLLLFIYLEVIQMIRAVSYTHLTLPTIYSV